MPGFTRFALAVVALGIPALASDTPEKEKGSEGTPVTATVESTLTTDSGQVRQFAFDCDPETYYASAKNPGPDDHFTLRFDRPVAVSSVVVTTGRPDGTGKLDDAALEVSGDGKTFHTLASFRDGTARGAPASREKVQAVRVSPGSDQDHPLIVREITIQSDPPVATFSYPVEVVVDVSDAPELKEWAEKVARECERAYPMINEELKSDGYRPAHLIRMTFRKDYRGVAMTGGTRITGSVAYYKASPDDVGSMIHETAHVVQNYRGRRNPGWLVEGVADYVRFFKYEPGKLGRINAARAHYNSSYRVTAAFLNYLAETYDRQVVRKLNALMRAGDYKDEVFQELTGKPLPELDKEWRATLHD